MLLVCAIGLAVTAASAHYVSRCNIAVMPSWGRPALFGIGALGAGAWLLGAVTGASREGRLGLLAVAVCLALYLVWIYYAVPDVC
jgi:hypothetical protein